jgi:hypothetical protein
LLIVMVLMPEPEQIDCEATETETVGRGFNVTVEVVDELQPLAVAMVVYVAVWLTFVVCDNVCTIEFPDPDEAPVIFGADTVQLNVVPEILLGLEIVTVPIGTPEHKVCDAVETATVGVGNTCTVSVATSVSQFGNGRFNV